MGVSSRHALRHPAQNLACSEFERTVGESGLWSRVYMSSCLRGILVVLLELVLRVTVTPGGLCCHGEREHAGSMQHAADLVPLVVRRPCVPPFTATSQIVKHIRTWRALSCIRRMLASSRACMLGGGAAVQPLLRLAGSSTWLTVLPLQVVDVEHLIVGVGYRSAT